MTPAIVLEAPPAGRASIGERAAWMMPVACGVLAGAVVFDAAPLALAAVGGWTLVWAAAGFGLMYATARMARTRGLRSTAWVATAGIGFHSILEGVVAGTGMRLGLAGALVVAVGLVMHLVPEGAALFGMLTDAGLSSRRALGRCAITWGLVLAGFLGARSLLDSVPVGPLGSAMGLAAGSFVFLTWVLWRKRTRGPGAWAAAALGMLWVAALHLH